MDDLAGHNWVRSINGLMIVSASSTHSQLLPYKAMDNGLGTLQYWVTNNVSTGWWKIDFGLYDGPDVRQVEITVNTLPEPNRAPKDFTIQGSNNDIDWDILKTVTGETGWSSGEKRSFNLTSYGNYRYYKIDITANNGDSYLQLGEVHFWGYQPASQDFLTHDWTGSTNGAMTVSASSYFSQLPPYKALDGDLGTLKYWVTNGTSTGWWKLDFGSGNQEEVETVFLQMNVLSESNRAPKDFTIKGSNDDSNWDTLLTVTGETGWSNGEWRSFVLSSTGNYRYYKIDVTDNNGDSYLQLGEVYFYNEISGFPVTTKKSSMFMVL